MPDDTPLSDYQQHLVVKHVGLAQNIAMAFWNRAPSIEREELIAVAYQGLVIAAQRFDPDFVPGNDPKYQSFLAFGAFAKRRITGEIQDWLRKVDHVPRRQRRTYRDIQQLGPGRSPEETAELLGIDVARVRAITHAVESPPVSLDEMQESRNKDVSQPGDSTDGTALTQLAQDALVRAFEEMGPMEKSVIALRYYEGLDFPKIAAFLGTSTAQVKAIHQEAVVVVHGVLARAVSAP